MFRGVNTMRNKFLMSIVLFSMMLGLIGTFSFAEERYELTIYVGEVIDLDSYLIDQRMISADESMEWSSGNDRIIKVNSRGVVTGLEEGRATIYVKSNTEATRVAVIKINVISMIEGFELKDEEVTLQVGEVYNLEYEFAVTGDNNSVLEDEITWSSSNKRVIEVDDNGQIVAKNEGTATIRAVTKDGRKKDDVLITVIGVKEEIVIDGGKEKVSIYVGGQHSFKATSSGVDVTLGVRWTSAITDVLKINERTGVAEGLKAGNTQVKAWTADRKKFDTVLVEVVSMVKDIKISSEKENLDSIGATVDLDYTLIYAFEGLDPFEDGVTWKSSNSSIASVDSNGVVKAKKGGIARITVTSKDGKHSDYCSVDVLGGKKEKDVLVEEVGLENPKTELFVGEKYELPVYYKPDNATKTKLYFGLKNGGSSQVKKEDDVYYFTPTVAGKNELTIKSESEETATYKFNIISPIRSVSVKTEALVKDGSNYVYYVGQKMKLEPVFKLKSGYTEEDIHQKDVTWSVEDKDILKVDKKKNDDGEYEYWLVGKEKGTTTLKVKSKDGSHENEIKIRVLSSYSKINVEDNVTFPINTDFIPGVSAEMKSGLKYDLVSGHNFELEKEVTIDKQFVKKEDIEAEIKLENQIILDLQKSAIDAENSAIIYKEINSHKSRISKLEMILKTVKNGYCEIRDNVELKDQFGDDFRVADIKKGVITGRRDGKIEVKVTFPGTVVSTKGTYYFSSELKGIIVVNKSGEIVGFNESGFAQVLTEDALKEQIELAKRFEKRYGNRTKEDTPSQEYVHQIMDLEELGFLPKSLKADYKEPVTRLELAETFVTLIEYISGDTMKKPNSSQFSDTTSKSANLAYNLGLVDVTITTKFEPYEKVTPVTLAKAMDKMITVLDVYGYSKDKLKLENDLNTGQKIFTDLDQVAPSHKAYVEKFTSTYGIIEGKDNKLKPLEGLTKEEFLYFVSKLVF